MNCFVFELGRGSGLKIILKRMAEWTGWLQITIVICLIVGCSRESRFTSLVSECPSSTYRVEIQELEKEGLFSDRNFNVVVFERGNSGQPKIVFSSPDEGRPIGTEKIVWSDDELSFVLLGRNFLSVNGAPEFRGDKLYLLYDFSTSELKCNSQQTDHVRFDFTDLKGFRRFKGGGG